MYSDDINSYYRFKRHQNNTILYDARNVSILLSRYIGYNLSELECNPKSGIYFRIRFPAFLHSQQQFCFYFAFSVPINV